MAQQFLKMHGLGNDFVVLDARTAPLPLSAAAIRAIADRRTGVGCDQLVLIGPARTVGADAFVRFFNPDGGEAGACGNASRCIGRLLAEESGRSTAVLETVAGLLYAELRADGLVSVDMGRPRLDWREIPLAEPVDTLSVPVAAGPLQGATCVSMGNPHAVFFVPDADGVDLAVHGPALEHHSLFPDRCNIEVATVLAPDRIRMRVWERGAGITRACGTGACATLVAAVRRGLSARSATLHLEGGDLRIDWPADDASVRMTGPAITSFTGTLTEALLAPAVPA